MAVHKDNAAAVELRNSVAQEKWIFVNIVFHHEVNLVALQKKYFIL